MDCPLSGLVVINDFNIEEVIAFDLKANPVLIINPNAVLSLPVSIEFLQTVCGRDTQILQASCIVDHDQFPQCN